MQVGVGPNTEAGEKSAYKNVQVGGAPTQRNWITNFNRQCKLGQDIDKKILFLQKLVFLMHEFYSCIHFLSRHQLQLMIKNHYIINHQWFFIISISLFYWKKKFTFVEHATIPKIIKKNKTISMMTLFKQPLSVSSDFLC